MKYIGPFLRMNSLNKQVIESQLFHLSKEALKHVVLQSKFGISTSVKNLKLKNIPTNDINTITGFSPLLCIYKKGSPKLVDLNSSYCWDEDKFKREVTIQSNAFMTLCLLELCDYYSTFKNPNTEKDTSFSLFHSIAKKQLEFYASYLRTSDGVFVDKKDESDDLGESFKFQEKDKDFKFSNQAFLMAAYYKCSIIEEDDCSTEYKNFSLDILNMFEEFKDEIYSLSTEELLKLCLGFNIFYSYSNLDKAKCLLIDIAEYILDNFEEYTSNLIDDNNIVNSCLFYINCLCLYQNTELLKFKEAGEKIYEKLMDLYDPELGIFIKNSDKKELEYSADEIVLYIFCILLNSEVNEEELNKDILLDVFKHQLVNSGILLSWPEAPNLSDIERYKNHSLKSEDLIEEQYFRPETIATPENIRLAPVFSKYITFNRKKQTFKQSKPSYDSTKNMTLLFLILHYYNCKN